jgi:hypothetical protein
MKIESGGIIMSFTDKELMYACRVANSDLHIGFDLLYTSGYKPPIPIGMILDALQYNDIYDATSLTELNENELMIIREWKLVDYHDDNDGIADSGYYGCIIELDKERVIVASRGSESPNVFKHRVADWVFADLMLITSELTSQMRECAYFAERIAYSDYIYRYREMGVAGHSLGGNLAQHFTIVSHTYGLSDMITKSVNFDGPGFSEEYLDVPEHKMGIKLMESKMYNYGWSFIGSLLTYVGITTFIKANREGKNFITIHKLDSIIYNVDSVTRGEQGALEKYIGDLSRRIDRQPDRVGYGVFVLLSTLLTTGYWLFEYMFDAAGDITSSGYLMIINLLVYLSPFVGDAESIALALVGLSQMNRAIGGDSKKIRAISKRLSSALGDINKWPIEYRESISNEVLKSLSAPLSLGFY